MTKCKECGSELKNSNEGVLRITKEIENKGYRVVARTWYGNGDMQFMVSKNGKAVIIWYPSIPTYSELKQFFIEVENKLK